MSPLALTREDVEAGFFEPSVARILELQRHSGAIPWYDGGVLDTWNHVEAAMGLAVMGELEAARQAYDYLSDILLEDGSWWSQYGAMAPLDTDTYKGDGTSEKRIRDTNCTAYPATGLWHYYLVTEELDFLDSHWPMVERAIEFVLDLQYAEGDIRWSARDSGTPEEDALVTGCSSIYKSLECASRIADALGRPRPRWAQARARLGEALRDKPYRFDRQWESKAHYAMDWFYPVLSGVFPRGQGRERLAARWDEFVMEGRGCRCVLHHPWVTVAETCELAIALAAVGEQARAQQVFSWCHQWRDDDGAYWMGYQVEENVPWPRERPAWTAAAVILAADTLLGLSRGRMLFTEILPE